MSEEQVRVVAHFNVKSDRVEEFIAAARKLLVDPARTEPGCIRYDLCQDLSDPERFAMIEVWESNEALDAHLSLKSLQAAVARLMPMADGPPVVQRLRSLTGAG